MNKYKVSYFYQAQGMDYADSTPETIIEAETRDEAIYKYQHSNRMSFENFLKEDKTKREWGITCEIIHNLPGIGGTSIQIDLKKEWFIKHDLIEEEIKAHLNAYFVTDKVLYNAHVYIPFGMKQAWRPDYDCTEEEVEVYNNKIDSLMELKEFQKTHTPDDFNKIFTTICFEQKWQPFFNCTIEEFNSLKKDINNIFTNTIF